MGDWPRFAPVKITSPIDVIVSDVRDYPQVEGKIDDEATTLRALAFELFEKAGAEPEDNDLITLIIKDPRGAPVAVAILYDLELASARDGEVTVDARHLVAETEKGAGIGLPFVEILHGFAMVNTKGAPRPDLVINLRKPGVLDGKKVA